MLTHLATGLHTADARDDFRRARRSGALGRAVRRLRGNACCGAPRTPSAGAAVLRGAPRLDVIALDAIAGTLEPTTAFDARLRPASEHVRARWERVALAYRRGIALPPIVVERHADGYYVVDGRHRVSVARALGHRDIEAWVLETARPA